MGLLDSIGGYLGNEENRLRLASGFNNMSGNPNAGNIQIGINQRLKGLSDDRKLKTANELASSKLQIQTQQAIRLIGQEYPDIAQAIQGRFMTPKEGVIEAMNRRNAPAERKMFKGADNFNYYEDDRSRVLPDLVLPPEKGTTAIQEYNYAVGQGFEGSFNDYILGQKTAGAPKTEVSYNGSSGAPAKAPNGMTNVTDIETGVVTQVPIKGGVVDIAAQKQVTNANNALETIDSALNHPGLNAAVGSIDSKFVSLSPDAVAFEAYHDQIKGKAFLAAFESLKGGGQITEVEGLKAEQATARLNLAQDEEDYKKALMDLKSVINDVLKRNQNVLGSIPASNNADPLGLRE